jgi:hypothetical protein
MRDHDKMKDDAIAHLSDQLITLTARLDSIEKRQQYNTCDNSVVASRKSLA